jgi:hypothetical protein
MDWLWESPEAPRDIPQWVYTYLVVNLEADVDRLARLKCVEQVGYEGKRAVTFIRLFHPESARKTGAIRNFAALDQHPELILYEGYREEKTGRIEISPAGIQNQGAPQ